MRTLLLLPLLIPALTAACCLLSWSSPRRSQRIGLAGTVLLVSAAAALLAQVARDGVLVTQIGNWPAPFGISIVADMFGALMVLVAAVIGVATMIYSLAEVDIERHRFGFPVLLNTLLMGVCGAFLTGDVFNLFVWFEVMLMASFVLVALGGERAQMEGAIHYVTMNLFSSMLFLVSVGILYSTAHTLNMAHLAVKLPIVMAEHPNLVHAVGLLFVIAFGVKAGVFPLFFWLPASYHTPPAAVSAVFAGLLTKVGVYALLRVFLIVFPPMTGVYQLILIIAGVTMLTGVLGAVSQSDVRRILSFHIISQIGYMIMGLGLLVSPDPATRRLAIAGTIFYIVHHIIVKSNLFLIGGAIRQLRGTTYLPDLGGLKSASPWLAVLFLIPAMSLAGLPPLSGFWAKLMVIKAGLMAHQYLLVFVALLTSLITLISMLKVWNEAFWKPAPLEQVISAQVRQQTIGGRACLFGPIVLLAAITLFISFLPRPLFHAADRAAVQLLNPAEYIRAVDLQALQPDVVPAEVRP
jgi:multicomponent Na+:H+ antiporter subunit D